MPGKNLLQLPKFTGINDIVEIPGCQLSFWGLYGLERCEVPAVFAVGFWDTEVQEPVLCCIGHVAKAITQQLDAIPATVMYEPGIVHVWKLTGNSLAEYNSQENQNARDETVQSTRMEGISCPPRIQIEASGQSQRRYQLP